MISTQEKTIEILTNTNDIYAASYADIRKSMNDLRLQMEENNKRLDQHYTTISRNLSVSEARISALEKAASRTGVFEAKPGLTTLKAKKAIKENEENFSCLTGNTDYCSPSPAQ
ncbi:outer membrane lipoprotein i-spanin [Providencia phage vB_PreS_PR1]|uniref:Outer membrane lipoprotein i-spanin n=1 Tax=Providencia phage vB_PreS_PR1 TaxID=1931407 RepID=A0A1S6KV32_9CAUD|nr:outer membrane lipoprotein i-spanin [Providencia phage vB_PreS_PR1]AQT25303.1 outer membrane lipoprotein i-spanin [Providencia phage vB_PreS_PR1]